MKGQGGEKEGGGLTRTSFSNRASHSVVTLMVRTTLELKPRKEQQVGAYCAQVRRTGVQLGGGRRSAGRGTSERNPQRRWLKVSQTSTLTVAACAAQRSAAQRAQRTTIDSPSSLYWYPLAVATVSFWVTE